MRHIVMSAVACGLALAVLSGVRAADTPKSKAKTVKPAVAEGYGNADAISEEELKIYDYSLASDQMEGRNFPSRGYDTAALYVASHLAEWGLKPGGSQSGTIGPLQPYFMPIELVTRRVVAEESKASLTGPAFAGRGGFGGFGGAGGQGGGGRAGGAAENRTTEFAYGKDWTAGGGGGFGGGGGRGAQLESYDVSGNLVFAGNGYVINKTKTNPYEGIDVRGKIIVVAGLPAELANQGGRGGRGGAGGRGARGGAAGETAAETNTEQPGAGAGGGGRGPNPLGEACTDYMTPEQYAHKNGALAVVTITSFQQLAGGGGRGPSLNGPNYQVKKFQNAGTCPNAPSITAGVEMTNALFQGERISGAQVFYGQRTNAKQDSFELSARKKLSLKVTV
ncbi:MAG TPA: hypothetical protein VGF59_36585, partial [Bryobacteraceae bacterium]